MKSYFTLKNLLIAGAVYLAGYAAYRFYERGEQNKNKGY